MKTVLDVFRLRKQVDGDIGLEIEVEGANLPMARGNWRNEIDGSLRGEEAREYVIKCPTSLPGLANDLNSLSGQFAANKARIDETVRAGVHVHINCQRLTMLELYTYIVVYLILENLLVKWCGESREGNLFCLRASDAEGSVIRLIQAARRNKDYAEMFYDDTIRYSSLNLKALSEYGSLEFRSMRSTKDFMLILKWAAVLLGLREASKKFKSPSDVIESLSINGQEWFLKSTLGGYAAEFAPNMQEAHECLWVGMRSAQDVAYCVDWGEWQEAQETRPVRPHKPAAMQYDRGLDVAFAGNANVRAANAVEALENYMREKGMKFRPDDEPEEDL